MEAAEVSVLLNLLTFYLLYLMALRSCPKPSSFIKQNWGVESGVSKHDGAVKW